MFAVLDVFSSFQRLFELTLEHEIIDFEQYSSIMQLLDLNPKLVQVKEKTKTQCSKI